MRGKTSSAEQNSAYVGPAVPECITGKRSQYTVDDRIARVGGVVKNDVLASSQLGGILSSSVSVEQAFE